MLTHNYATRLYVAFFLILFIESGLAQQTYGAAEANARKLAGELVAAKTSPNVRLDLFRRVDLEDRIARFHPHRNEAQCVYVFIVVPSTVVDRTMIVVVNMHSRAAFGLRGFAPRQLSAFNDLASTLGLRVNHANALDYARLFVDLTGMPSSTILSSRANLRAVLNDYSSSRLEGMPDESPLPRRALNEWWAQFEASAIRVAPSIKNTRNGTRVDIATLVLRVADWPSIERWAIDVQKNGVVSPTGRVLFSPEMRSPGTVGASGDGANARN